MSARNISLETYEEATELLRLANSAIHQVQAENREKGIPNVYGIGGVIYYEQPDGTLSQIDPWETSQEKIESS